MAQSRQRIRVVDLDDTLRVGKRQRPENQRIQHGEDRGIPTDAQRKCEKHGQGEVFVLDQHTQSETGVS